MRARFRKFLKTRDGAFALGIVLACGLALSFFTWRTFVDPLPGQYRLDFGNARWIEPATPSPCGYFRKTLYISGSVEHAWIEFSATDHVYVFVNGVFVNETNFSCARVSGIFDIKHLLTTGKNVIAVYVPRVFQPGSSQILVRGFYATDTSPLTEFRTDATWKASTTPDRIIGGYKWNDPMLDDALWANARETTPGERFPTVQTVSVDPRIFQRRPSANWLGPRLVGAQDATFETSVRVPPFRGATWLQIAATGGYDAVINGRLAVSQGGPQRTTLPFAIQSSSGPESVSIPDLQTATQQARTAADLLSPLAVGTATGAPTLMAYDITRWMRAGDNSILIHVRSENGIAALLAEGFTSMPGEETRTFATDGKWKVREAAPGVSSGGNAVVIGPCGTRPWGWLPQSPSAPTTQPGDDLQLFARRTATFFLVEFFVVVLWLAVSAWRGKTGGWTFENALTADALLHVPVLATLLLLWLLSYDVRFANDWCFKPRIVLGGFALLLASRVCLLLCVRTPEIGAPRRSFGARYWKLAAFALVMLLGFWLRARGLNSMSLGSDEMTMVLNADGVRESLYPHAHKGSFDRMLATYELIPYSLGISSFLFGRTEFAYHFMALIFSTLTVGLIGFVGTRMKDWRVGFIASLIYACFPPSIAWARNAFYPSQEQFLSLWTFWFFYEAVRGKELNPKFVTLSSIGFLLSYFSWEGSGFILPAFFIAMFALRWGETKWMKDGHLWRCAIITACIVLIQLSYRQLAADSYDIVGYSLSDITAPTPIYGDLLVYNPMYYVKVLFFSEVNFVISLFVFGGFLLCWRDRAIRYLVVVLFVLELCYTNLLPFYAPRYCYNAETLVILAGVAIFFKMRDRIAHLGGVAIPRGWPRTLRWSGAAALTVVFVLATNEHVLKLFRLSENAENPALFGRLGYYKTDHRGAARFVAERLQPGDCVVAFMPHVFEFYAHKHADYSLNTFLNTKMSYDGGLEHPQFIDKFLGRPLIRSAEEFKDILSRSKRIWVVVPIHDENELLSPDMWQFLDKRGRVAFESYREQVILVEAAQSTAARQSAE